MSAIRTNAAAAMLGVSPNTLRSWEQRFGYPSPRRTEGGHRQFELMEIEALRQAFEETHNISSAVSIARERGAGGASLSRVRSALAALDQERADRLLEESLAVRSVERTVESLLLGAVRSLGEDSAAGEGAAGEGISPEYGFAWRYATGWLAAALRVAPPVAAATDGVLIVDATRPPEMDALHVQALELFLRRSCLRVLTLPVELQATRVGHALRALRPRAMVLAGGGASLDALGRLVYAARQSTGGALEVLDYRGALPDTGASTVTRLDDEPEAAARALRERLGESALGRSAVRSAS
ncbi:MAG: MerR family DNA-binding transcriptional regulator [Solirubrobacterales bacterium]